MEDGRGQGSGFRKEGTQGKAMGRFVVKRGWGGGGWWDFFAEVAGEPGE